MYMSDVAWSILGSILAEQLHFHSLHKQCVLGVRVCQFSLCLLNTETESSSSEDTYCSKSDQMNIKLSNVVLSAI